VVEASATGGLSSARAVVSGSALGVAGAEAQVAAAEAGIERALAEHRKAKTDLERAEQLFTAKAIPQERLDNARVAFDATKAALQQAQAQAAMAKEARRVAQSRVAEAAGRLSQSSPIDSQIAVARANAALAHARVKSAEAALELAKLQLSYTKVTAPDDGLVSRLSAREGQLVQPGQAIAQLVPSETYVVANLKETQIGELSPGDRAEITVEAFPGRTFEGRVESLSGGTGARFSLLPPDNASGNFVKVVQRVPVRIVWAHPPEVPMRAGLSAEVTVTTGTHPAAAVARSGS
jgi:membrane fusion protein (multidrug efflux system)